jgi:hypothetical protein
MKPYELYRSLHARGETLETLAVKCKTHPNQISMVFRGHRGGNSRKHIAPWLTPEERAVLGWDENGEIVAGPERRPGTVGEPAGGTPAPRWIVPRETSSQV